MRRFMHLSSQGQLAKAKGWPDESLVFARGAAASHVYFLEHGAVEIVQARAEGQSVVVKILLGPTLFGVIEAMGGEPTYLESVRCLGGARTFQLPTDSFRALVSTDVAVANEVTTDLSLAFAAAAKFEASRLYDADVMLANLLVAYADLFGEETRGEETSGEETDAGVRLRVRRTQEQLAAAIGASERQVARLMSDWKHQGLLGKRDGLYVLKQPDFFRSLSGPLAGSLVHRHTALADALPSLKLHSR